SLLSSLSRIARMFIFSNDSNAFLLSADKPASFTFKNEGERSSATKFGSSVFCTKYFWILGSFVQEKTINATRQLTIAFIFSDFLLCSILYRPEDSFSRSGPILRSGQNHR